MKHRNHRMIITIGLLAALVGTQAAFAAEDLTTYTLDELHFQCSFPAYMEIMDRKIAEDDPKLSAFSMTAEEYVQFCEENNIYLDLIDSFNQCDVMVSMMDSDATQAVFDLGLLSTEELTSVKALVEKQALGTVSEIGDEQRGDAVYIGYQGVFTQDGLDVPYLNYTTIYNGISISIMLRSYESTLTEQQRNVFQNIINSIVYTEKLPAPVHTKTETKTNLVLDVLAVLISLSVMVSGVIGIRKMREKKRNPSPLVKETPHNKLKH